MLNTKLKKYKEVNLKKTIRRIQTSFQNPYHLNRSIGTLEIENI
jgi:hypothetical protein